MLRALLSLAALVATPAAMVGAAAAEAYSPPSAAEARSAMEQAAKARVLLWGYFSRVDDAADIAEAAAQMQGRLRALGVPARIGRCEWMGVVANGNASGNRAYGAACRVAIGDQPERSLLLCSSTLGGITLVAPDTYAFDADYIELFIRRACL